MIGMTRRRRFATPLQIFDVEDHFARGQGIYGLHPRPLEPLRFYLVGQMVDGVRHPFASRLELLVQRTPSGYHLFWGKVKRVNAADQRRFLGNEGAGDVNGGYILRIESRYYQPLEQTDLQIPIGNPYQATHLDLLPGYAYPFPSGAAKSLKTPTLLRGNVIHPQGVGLADVQIVVKEQPAIDYLTDRSGQWVLVFPEQSFPEPVPGASQLAVTLQFLHAGLLKKEVPTVVQRGQQQGLPAPVVFAL
jgi:hypothetical protein